MGNKPAEKKKITGFEDSTSLIKEYTPAFEQYKANKNYFSTKCIIKFSLFHKILHLRIILTNYFLMHVFSYNSS